MAVFMAWLCNNIQTKPREITAGLSQEEPSTIFVAYCPYKGRNMDKCDTTVVLQEAGKYYYLKGMSLSNHRNYRCSVLEIISTSASTTLG